MGFGYSKQITRQQLLRSSTVPFANCARAA